MKESGKKSKNYTSAPEIAFQTSKDGGFTLIEVIIAMVILMIVLLGVFVSFTYAVNYNAGNNSRAQALSVLQQEIELLRSAKFTPSITDANLLGGEQAARIVSSADGNRFRVQITVDDDPFAGGVQIDTTKTLKEITLTITLENPTPGWQTAVPARVILRRVRAN
jgi:prepilin-type N-terminal cleavage/methylation domain-containing protein